MLQPEGESLPLLPLSTPSLSEVTISVPGPLLKKPHSYLRLGPPCQENRELRDSNLEPKQTSVKMAQEKIPKRAMFARIRETSGILSFSWSSKRNWFCQFWVWD